ncbi:MAG: hypothetical protein IJX23_05470 [Clostridia bacterium]|nr:hypothetical protein [Clostridia bacterium]
MVNHYAERFQWIFKYTSKNLGYCILKTLCIIVGLPIYLVCFVAEMALTLVNLLFSFVPGLGLVVMLVCKMLMWIIDKPYYICVLTDLKRFYLTTHDTPEYADFTHVATASQQTDDVNNATETDTQN